MSGGSSELRQVRARIEKLRAAGQDPLEVILSPETWNRLMREYLAFTPGLQPARVAVRNVLGVRGRLVAGAQGCAIRYFGGMDLPPDQAVVDGFIDLSGLQEREGAESGRRAAPSATAAP